MCALDAGGALYNLLGENSDPHAIVILDPDGNVVYRGADPKKGNYFYKGAEKLPCAYVDLKRAVEKHKDKGLLADLTLPGKFGPIAAAIKQGQLAKAQSWLKRVPHSGDYAAPKAELEKRLEALRQKKRAFFDTLLAEGKLWDAYKAGASYVRCFPRAPDGAEVKAKLTALKPKPAVKENLDARKAFRRYAVACYGAKRVIKTPGRVAALFEKFAAKHDGTEYGDAAKALAQ